MKLSVAAGLVLALALPIAAGCGSEGEAKKVAVDFATRAGQGDAAGACKLVALNGYAGSGPAEALGQSPLEGCIAYLGTVGVETFVEAKRVEIKADAASVEVTGSGGGLIIVKLKKVDDKWLVVKAK